MKTNWRIGIDQQKQIERLSNRILNANTQNRAYSSGKADLGILTTLTTENA